MTVASSTRVLPTRTEPSASILKGVGIASIERDIGRASRKALESVTSTLPEGRGPDPTERTRARPTALRYRAGLRPRPGAGAGGGRDRAGAGRGRGGGGGP